MKHKSTRSLALSLLALITCLGCSSATAVDPASGTTTRVARAAQVTRAIGVALPAHAWKVEIDGTTVGGFKELAMTVNGRRVEGYEAIAALDKEIEIVEYRDGDDPVARKRPGRVKYADITLERGFLAAEGVPAWFEGGPAARKSVSIIYLDRSGREALRYNLFECWPVAAKGGVLIDAEADVALVHEKIEIAVEKVERASRSRHDTPKNAIGNIR